MPRALREACLDAKLHLLARLRPPPSQVCIDCRVLRVMIAKFDCRSYLHHGLVEEPEGRALVPRGREACRSGTKRVRRTPRRMHELLVVRDPGSGCNRHLSHWPTLIKHREGALRFPAIDGRIACESACPGSWGSDHLLKIPNLGPRGQALPLHAAASLEA